MINYDYELVMWPEIQGLMDKPGFGENACLANDDYFVATYGSSAYFVNKQWLNEVCDDMYKQQPPSF